jgi:hypothetical protein
MTDQPVTPFDGDPLAAVGLYAAAAEHELEESAAHAHIDDRVAQLNIGAAQAFAMLAQAAATLAAADIVATHRVRSRSDVDIWTGWQNPAYQQLV